jgi:hypothetical protein
MITFDTNQITFDTNLMTWDGWYPPLMLLGSLHVRPALEAELLVNLN